MSTTQPIKEMETVQELKDYWRIVKPNKRNYLLTTMALNTALRISDLLELHYSDVYCYAEHRVADHIIVRENKTGKTNCIYINDELRATVESLANCEDHNSHDWLFASHKYPGTPLSRFQAYRIVREAADAINIGRSVSPHSLRKTFGYHAWQNGVNPVLLMNIYNHSSYQVTKRYLGIDQDEKDEVYRNICL